MSRQPFLLGHPRELGRLFATDFIHAPDGNRWNITFCPGLKGAWTGFKKCWSFGWDAFKWAWTDHGKIIKFMWEMAGELGSASKDLIASIPSGFNEGLGNISSLWADASFGWIARVLKNIIWNCFICPIGKFILGGVGMVVGTPLLFIFGSIIGCGGKWIIGIIGSIGGAVASVFPLIGGTIISGGVTFGALFNRFPKESDNGTYGLQIALK